MSPAACGWSTSRWPDERHPPRHGRSTRGAGSKREIRPGVWKLTVSAGRDDSGTYRRVSRTIHGTRAQAARALARFAAEVRGPDDPATSTPPWTLTELVARYLSHLEHTQRSPGRFNAGNLPLPDFDAAE